MSNDDRWQTLMDELARLAIGDGRADHLPGAGKPLSLDEDPNTPGDMRMAFKIMRDNDIAPDWIASGKALELAATSIQAALEQLLAVPAGERQTAAWQRRLEELRERVREHNNDVLSFNLKVPSGIRHRRQIDLDREMARRG